MAKATFLASDEWRELTGNAGLKDIVARTYTLTAPRQLINEIRGFGFKDLMRGWSQFFSLYIKSPAFRKYAKEITPSHAIIKSLFAYVGF
jgi:hypothetical protein